MGKENEKHEVTDANSNQKEMQNNSGTPKTRNATSKEKHPKTPKLIQDGDSERVNELEKNLELYKGFKKANEDQLKDPSLIKDPIIFKACIENNQYLDEIITKIEANLSLTKKSNSGKESDAEIRKRKNDNYSFVRSSYIKSIDN